MPIVVAEYVARWTVSPFADVADPPWRVTQNAEAHVLKAMAKLPADYDIVDGVAVHRTAIVEPGAVVKGPAIIGPRCFVAASAYLRGGVFMDEDCIVGPGAELKTTFMFTGSKLAHFNFVGDSILGAAVNLEAGSIVANYRNELDDKVIRIRCGHEVIDTGVEKFGALAADGTRVGANAVIAPGAIFERNTRVPRLSLVDQHPLASPVAD
jgi:NDP-sugar pyrophosphorylase family protein